MVVVPTQNYVIFCNDNEIRCEIYKIRSRKLSSKRGTKVPFPVSVSGANSPRFFVMRWWKFCK